MTGAPLTELQLFLQVVQTGGTLTILAFMVWAFYSGNIVSKPVLDKILDQYAQHWAVTTEKILTRIDDLSEAATKAGKRGKDGWS